MTLCHNKSFILKFSRMKITCFLLLFFVHSSFAQSLVHHAGALSTMGKENFKATVLLDTLSKSNLNGIGPYGKMQGEITVLDGTPYVSQVLTNNTATVSENWQAEAPFFVYANVNRWVSYSLKTSIENLSDLQRVIEALATKNGYDVTVPFPFKISGTFTELTTHVVTPRSADIPGYQAGRNQENYSFTNIKGDLIGFYSQHHQGVYTHRDSFIHTHFINTDRTIMGHVDKIAVNKSKLTILFPLTN